MFLLKTTMNTIAIKTAYNTPHLNFKTTPKSHKLQKFKFSFSPSIHSKSDRKSDDDFMTYGERLLLISQSSPTPSLFHPRLLKMYSGCLANTSLNLFIGKQNTNRLGLQLKEHILYISLFPLLLKSFADGESLFKGGCQKTFFRMNEAHLYFGLACKNFSLSFMRGSLYKKWMFISV